MTVLRDPRLGGKLTTARRDMTIARPAQVKNDLVRISGATSVSPRAADLAQPAMADWYPIRIQAGR